MKKLIVLIATIFIFSETFSQLQTANQESVVDTAFLKKRAAYIDSLVDKTSVKQLVEFFQESVSLKAYTENKFIDMYQYFLNINIDAWTKKQKPPGKKN